MSVFYQKNRQSLLKKIENNSLVLFFSDQHQFNEELFATAKFEVNKNFYYLTGIEQKNVVLLMVKNEQKEEAFLFLDPVDPVKKLWDGETLSFAKAAEISSIPVENCLDINLLKTLVFSLLNTVKISKFGYMENIYLDLSKFKLKDNLSVSLKMANLIQTNYPFLRIKDHCHLVADLRITKKPEEIALIQQAIALNKTALEGIAQKMQPGLYEYEISAFYHYVLESHGATNSFHTIVASGNNATILHYNQQKSPIGANDLVLIDCGVRYQNYTSDVSRCFPASGKFTPQQKQIYEIVLKANKKTIEWIKPGYTFAEMNQYGKQILSDGLSELGFLKKDESIDKYCYHGLGHYLGLEVHDVGNSFEPIKENSIITIEPGLYLPELSLGIRVEDDVLVSSNGNVNLTHNIPKEIDDIEKLMTK
ncbi:Xaa-Pro aminopeptidase [Candidatus Phytoplasma pruni]|uniref:Xaa-Pro aminopeptidase n=1 Tax=Candidatus Phytoplasma pruni TaxID=479893 RepID=A0A0M1N0Q3_9MOLU|nr:aminopeptidase P family protein [Candidatus Phytoplasma pruni]KOR75731.1 Xaa-Pro aminopeptidase [Candidatus Phytoplasma pruni]MCQ9618770.1 Aminopeptidase P N-terminal domain containing protein [Candidatus Phytoplasma pruni]MDW3617628.1 Xaa-Pro aminopeptidase [Candidatus Phytoplasma pruni]